MNPTRLPAQIPAAIAARLRQIGTVVETAETGALYAPLHPREPYANVHVIRDQAYGDDPRHLLDVFTPQRADDTPRPVFIFVHGGGFVAGNKRSDDSPFYDNLMLWAVANGLVGVNITHRLAPAHPWPAAQQDIAAALRWVQANIAAHGGDGQRIILAGHSSGAAHIAQYLAHPALRLSNDGVRGAILISGLYDTVRITPNPYLYAYFGDDPAQLAARSALPGLLQAGVPLFIASAELDLPDFPQQAALLGIPHYQLAGHSHISEIFAVGSGDNALGEAMRHFIAQDAAL